MKKIDYTIGIGEREEITTEELFQRLLLLEDEVKTLKKKIKKLNKKIKR